MAAPGGQQAPRRRLALAIVAGGLALVVALTAVSVVLLVGDDESRADRSDDTASAEPTPDDPTPDDPTSSPPENTGPPATIELRRVLRLLPASADCAAAGVWCTQGRTESYRLGPAELRTPDIVEAEARFSDYGQWVVGVTLSDHGATRFEAVTRELAGNTGPSAQLAIVVDNLVISAPVVQSAIPGGEIDISASFSQTEAERLAAAIQP